jgi:hypothetical protein
MKGTDYPDGTLLIGRTNLADASPIIVVKVVGRTSECLQVKFCDRKVMPLSHHEDKYSESWFETYDPDSTHGEVHDLTWSDELNASTLNKEYAFDSKPFDPTVLVHNVAYKVSAQYVRW